MAVPWPPLPFPGLKTGRCLGELVASWSHLTRLPEGRSNVRRPISDDVRRASQLSRVPSLTYAATQLNRVSPLHSSALPNERVSFHHTPSTLSCPLGGSRVRLDLDRHHRVHFNRIALHRLLSHPKTQRRYASAKLHSYLAHHLGCGS